MIASIILERGQLIVLDNEERLTVPFDVDNRHYLEAVEWLKNEQILSSEVQPSDYDLVASTLGNKPSEEPTFNWDGLGRDLFSCKLSQEIISPIKQSTSPVPQQGAIWDTSDKVEKVVTLSYYSNQDRAKILKEYMAFLLEKVKEAGIEVPKATKQELVEIFRRNGFSEVADSL